MSNWTFDTCIELTPIGRTVANLHKRSRQLKALEFPGMNSDDRRLQTIAQGAANDADRLLSAVEETIWNAGAAVIAPDAETETPGLLPCGCYADACHCGQYPAELEIDTAVLEMLPLPTPEEFVSYMDALTEQSNFFGDPRN